MDICGVGEEEATSLFREADGNLKVAVVMKLGGLLPEESAKLLRENGGYLKKTLRGIPSSAGDP